MAEHRQRGRAAWHAVAALALAGGLAACAAGEVADPDPAAAPSHDGPAGTTPPSGAPAGPTTTEARPGDDRPAVVGSITDGDTFRTTTGERVRLIGIDTPEPSQDECFADEATSALSGLIPAGTAVRLRTDVEPADRYGRTLAYVFRERDGLLVNLELAALGVAVQLTVPPNVAMADEIGAIVADAREAGRGLWGGCPPEGAVPPVTPPAPSAPPPLPAVPSVPPATAAAPPPVPTTAPPEAAGCHPSYPDVCIPPAPPDLDCPQIPHRRFTVVGADPHGFDGDRDGIGCESG